MNENFYLIDSAEFEFETFGIVGVITEDEKFCWALDLYAHENQFQGNSVSPKFSFTLLEESKDYKFNESFKWKEITAYNYDIEDWIASFYIYDSHDFVANIDIKKLNNENFFVSIEGSVNINWETAPTKHFVNFKISKTAPFNGIICEIENKDKAFEIAGKFLNIEELQWLPKEETSSGENNWLTY